MDLVSRKLEKWKRAKSVEGIASTAANSSQLSPFLVLSNASGFNVHLVERDVDYLAGAVFTPRNSSHRPAIDGN